MASFGWLQLAEQSLHISGMTPSDQQGKKLSVDTCGVSHRGYTPSAYFRGIIQAESLLKITWKAVASSFKVIL